MTPQLQKLQDFLSKDDTDIEYDYYNKKLKATTLLVSDKEKPFDEYFYLELSNRDKTVRACYRLKDMQAEETIVVHIVTCIRSQLHLVIKLLNEFDITYNVEQGN